MTVTTGPTQINPTHHVKLTDGTNTVGLILVDGYGNPDARGFDRSTSNSAIKMYQGEQKYDDSMPPWTPQSMSDFSGGLGATVWDDDKSRYEWGNRAYTANGKFEIGPLPVWTKRTTSGNMNWLFRDNFNGINGVNYVWHELNDTNPAFACKFTAQTNYTATNVHIVIKDLTETLSVSIHSDSGGSPGAMVGTSATTTTTNGENFLTLEPCSLISGTSYWLKMSITAGFSCKILCGTMTSPDTKYYTAATSTWTAITGYRPYFRINEDDKPMKAHFFEYKGALFATAQFDSGETSKLYLNGDIGVVATAPNTYSVTIASTGHVATWVDNFAIGAIFVITAGAGSDEPRNFRVITGNTTTAGVLTLTFSSSDPWLRTLDSTTEFAIVSSERWTEITPDISGSNPWTNKSVKDVLSINQAVYFTLGDADEMIRMRAYNSSGTWTFSWTEEATDSLYTWIGKATDPEGSWIWAAKSGYPAQVAKAPTVDCTGTSAAANLVWETAIGVDNLGERITNLIEYGEDFGQMHVLKEGNLYRIALASDDTDYITRIPISGFPTTKDWRNGRAAVVHDTYLFFSWHDTVLRYYRNYLDNIGPNGSESKTPEDYRGVVSALASYPGMLFAAMDGGADKYSSILGYNGNGWCNLFTAPGRNLRIQNIYVQSAPGDNVDRLWFSCGGQFVWIPISTNTLAQKDIDYNPYVHAWDARLDMAKIFGARRKLLKYFNKLEFSVFQSTYGYIGSTYDDYRVKIFDSGMAASFATLTYSDTYDSSTDYGDELILTPYTAERVIKPTITIEADDSDAPFALENITFDSLTREKKRYIDTLTFRAADYDKDLNGDMDDYLDHNAKLNQLDAWDEGHTRLTMTAMAKQLDSKYVFIDTGPQRLKSIKTETGEQAYIMRMVVYEVGDSA